MRPGFIASIAVLVLALGACGPRPDRCEGFVCDPSRICIDLASGPTCACPDETAAPDGGQCVEQVADEPPDAGTP